MFRKAGLVFLLLAVLIIPLGLSEKDAHAEGPLVLAFYYAWFDMNSWDPAKMSDLPGQPYVSADAATITRQVSQAKGAGIDGFVQSWYGPGAGNQTEGNFQALLNIASAQGFRAAVDFEVGSPYFSGPDDRISALEHLLAVHANHPAYLRVDGKPVIFFWASWLLSVEDWAAIRSQVDPNHSSIWIVEGASLDYLSVFDGLHLYNIAWSGDPASTLINWGGQVRQRAQGLGVHKYWAATVMPGWDDTRIPGKTDTFIRNRAGGAYYQQSWSGATSSGADMVIITSFNEWMEGSQIEPSASYGNYYLDLTAQLAGAYRTGGSVAPAPLPTEPMQAVGELSPVPSPTAGPTLTTQPTNTPGPTATRKPSPTPLPDGSVVHVVETGDTLLGLSERYDVSLDALLALNGLELNNLLWVGQRIVVGTVEPTPTGIVSSPTADSSAQLDVSPTPSSAIPQQEEAYDKDGVSENVAQVTVVAAPTVTFSPTVEPVETPTETMIMAPVETRSIASIQWILVIPVLALLFIGLKLVRTGR